MIVKFIQINIYKGKYLDSLIEFLKKENADFVAMQEVTTNGFNLFRDKTVSLFEVLKNRLGMDGVFNGDLRLKGDEQNSTFGNAVFTKYKILDSQVITLKSFRAVTVAELDGESGEIREQIPRHLLDCEVEYMGDRIHILCWHGAWTAPPKDTEETLRQAKIVARHLEGIVAPFIMGCDANNVIGGKTIELVNNASKNLMIDSGVVQTTHPKIHKIVPRGYLIDYVFVSRDIKLKSLRVPEVLVSDHLPIVVELEL